MKKPILTLAALATIATASADQRAFYVKKGDSYTKYNYGVAENIKFLNDGHTMLVEGYDETVNLDSIDYITTNPPITTTLTSAAHKQKLEDIGREALAMVNLHDNADCLKMIHAFFDCEDDHHAPSEFDIDQSYYDVFNEFRSTMKAFSRLAKGDADAVRSLKSAVVNTYRFQYYHGTYTADQESRSWVKTANDHFEIRFKGFDNEDFAVTLTASGDEGQWVSRHFDIRFPNVIDIEFLNGKTVIAKGKLTTSLVQDSRIYMTFDFDANGYVVSNTQEILNDAINDKVNASINGKYFCSNTINLKGKNLLVYDEMYDAFKESMHYHDENDECCGEDPHLLFSHLTRVGFNFDLLGKLQIEGKANGFTKIYDTLAEYYDVYCGPDLGGGWSIYGNKIIQQKGNEYTVTNEDKDMALREAQTAANYFDCYFHYDGNSNTEGYVTIDVVEDSEERWVYENDYYSYAVIDGYLVRAQRDWEWVYDDEGNRTEVYGPWYCYKYNDDNDDYRSEQLEIDESALVHPSTITDVYYDIVPTMVFPDQTSYNFVDFFDNNSFGNIIDDYKDIVHTYHSITGQDDEDDD
jgi:hypothetical protein